MHPRLSVLRRFHTSPLFSPSPIAVPTLSRLSHSPLPITPQCPPPTCPCAEPPDNLDIDRLTPLAGTMPSYHRHLLISTGTTDWPSKIDLDPTFPFAHLVKSVSAQKGAGLRDPYAPVLITNSSFPLEEGREGGGFAAYVFPSGIYLSSIPGTREAVAALIRGYLLPGSSMPLQEFGGRRVTEAVVLICSHMSRDSRCGVVAPVLKGVFENVLRERGVDGRVKVGFTSHLSGHRFAGNVVVYLPPRREGEVGVGVWYGRVEGKHVEGIVDETVLGGRVVGELCRGIVGGEGHDGS